MVLQKNMSNQALKPVTPSAAAKTKTDQPTIA
jgi:hypothetical protein